MSSWWWWTVRI